MNRTVLQLLVLHVYKINMQWKCLQGIFKLHDLRLLTCNSDVLKYIALFPGLPSIQFSTDETELDYGRPWNEATLLAFKVKVTNIASSVICVVTSLSKLLSIVSISTCLNPFLHHSLLNNSKQCQFSHLILTGQTNLANFQVLLPLVWKTGAWFAT